MQFDQKATKIIFNKFNNSHDTVRIDQENNIPKHYDKIYIIHNIPVLKYIYQHDTIMVNCTLNHYSYNHPCLQYNAWL